MKTIDEGIEEFGRFSTKLSDNCRTLALAGIGIIWAFRTAEKSIGPYSWDPALTRPLVCFVTAVAFDLFQYLWLSAYWYIWYRWREHLNERRRGLGAQKAFYVNVRGIAPGVFFFFAKAMLLICGYVSLALWFKSDWNKPVRADSPPPPITVEVKGCCTCVPPPVVNVPLPGPEKPRPKAKVCCKCASSTP